MEYNLLINSIKGKLHRFNIIVEDAPIDNREYDMLLESYAEDIYEMCRKFYEADAGRTGVCKSVKEDYKIEGEVD